MAIGGSQYRSTDLAVPSSGTSLLTGPAVQALRGQIAALENHITTLREQLVEARQRARNAEERADEALDDLRTERISAAEERWCTEIGRLTASPSNLFRLHDADGDRLGNLDHSIKRFNGDRDFSLLSCEVAGTQARADDAFVATDRRLDETTTAVAGCLLPSHPAFLRNGADVAVALTRSLAI
jgi:hypothetical protein